jgi:hypothetical protein
MSLLKGAVLDMLYLWLLKNTEETAIQLNKYWHADLTLQHHSVLPPFCVYLICKATTHHTTSNTAQSVLCCCYQNTKYTDLSLKCKHYTYNYHDIQN